MNPVTGDLTMAPHVRDIRTAQPGREARPGESTATALAYKYTKREEYIGYFRRITGYYLEHLPADLCPYWDLMFSDAYGSDEPEGFFIRGHRGLAACWR